MTNSFKVFCGWLILGTSLAMSQELSLVAPEKVAGVPHLPNAIQIHSQVISGGMPEGDESFEELQRLGIKTIISVDGAKPDLELATKYGMHYVHLPHGYDGISVERSKQLAKAVQSLPKPIYIHCHHGKHRSPAAAAVACISAGMVSPTMASNILAKAGTSPNYQGLHESALNAKALPASELASITNDFPEVADLPEMAEAMVEIEHTFDHLQQLAKANWMKVASNPDLDAAHETLLLREHYTEMLRKDEVKKQPTAFIDLLKQAEVDCQELEDSLRQWKLNATPSLAEVRDSTWQRISQGCSTCHRQFRDTPLSQKSSSKAEAKSQPK